MLHWTKSPPTKPGHYWRRPVKDFSWAYIVHIFEEQGILWVEDNTAPGTNHSPVERWPDGLWAGPVEPPASD